jgi:hypothetical protein
MFVPDEAVAAVERTKLATKYCAECRVVPAKHGYHGYCKGCYGRKDTVGVEVTEQRCFYCNLTGATVIACGWATGCSREVAICEVCISQWEKPVCDACWGREWSSGCFSCKQPVSSSQAWRVRYCAACYRKSSVMLASSNRHAGSVRQRQPWTLARVNMTKTAPDP